MKIRFQTNNGHEQKKETSLWKKVKMFSKKGSKKNEFWSEEQIMETLHLIVVRSYLQEESKSNDYAWDPEVFDDGYAFHHLIRHMMKAKMWKQSFWLLKNEAFIGVA